MSVNILRYMEPYHQNRTSFVVKVYTVTSCGVLLTLAQWIPILIIDEWRKEFRSWEFLTYFATFGGFIALVLFTNFKHCRLVHPFNILMSILIVECFTFGLIKTVIYAGMELFGLSLLTAIMLITLSNGIGVVLKRDLTECLMFFASCAFIFFILAIIFMILSFVTTNPIFGTIFCVTAIIFVLVFSAFHTQIIVGGREAELDTRDYLMGSMIAYLDFIILLAMVVFMVTVIYGKNVI